MTEEQKEENTYVPGSSLEKPSLFKDGYNPEEEVIEDPEELEKMEEMWSKMFKRELIPHSMRLVVFLQQENKVFIIFIVCQPNALSKGSPRQRYQPQRINKFYPKEFYKRLKLSILVLQAVFWLFQNHLTFFVLYYFFRGKQNQQSKVPESV